MQGKKINCDSLSDQEIVSRSLEDLDYFRCLYERYEKRLKLYIFNISNFRSEEADDILQNAFINIWKNLNSYDESLKLSGFLYRIVHNETISQWRKQSSANKINDEYSSREIDDDNSYIADDNHISIKNRINSILELLPLKYKDVLVLKFLENMDYEEISNILRIPEGTVATRINRAKKAFAKISKEKGINAKFIIK